MKLKKLVCTLTVISLLTAAGCSAGDMGASESVTNEAYVPITDSDSKGETKSEDTNAAVESGGAEDAAATEGVAEDGDVMEDLGVFDAAGEAKTEAKKAEAEETDTAKTEEIAPESEIVEMPEAGQLTAGEWNDNDNWGFFTNLVNSKKITFPSFGIDPRYRTAVTVKNDDGSVLVNAKARLLDAGGKVLWSGVTDKKGRVYLFASNDSEAVSVEIESGENKQSFELKTAVNNTQGENQTAANEMEVTFKGENKLHKKTDIMFIVDATGSMSDEMMFLQSEFTAITKEIGTDNTRYSVNFYRDKGDDYVTKCYDFTDDIKDLQEKLNSERADGGGDTPEAVAEILQETMTKSSWDDDSVKLAFMIFDAPPHEGTEEIILSAAKTAAEKGIRIIPVVSSNSERDTELFARALSITTGGTYVFLTDDSGIGDSHLEPIIGDYEVEKLYDIIIRVINDFKQ